MVARYTYDAWGNLLSSDGAQAASNLFRYATKEYHGASGLYDYGMRFYSPSLGTWMSRDPSKEQGGLNLYQFVANNPMSFVDPYGLSWTSFIQGFATGFGVGFITGALVAAAISAVGAVFPAITLAISIVGGAAGALAVMEEINELLSGNICPDERDYRIGMLIGGLLGGYMGAKLGPKLLAPKPRLPNLPPEPLPPGDPIPDVPLTPDGCFVAGTVVVMADGSLKVIEQVKQKEWVLSRDASGKLVKQKYLAAPDPYTGQPYNWKWGK